MILTDSMMNAAANATTSASAATEAKRKVVASDKPKKCKESLAGVYTATDTIYMRSGAGTKHNTMTIISQGTTITSSGYYSSSGGAKWLYGQVTINGVEYTGFCSIKYLKK